MADMSPQQLVFLQTYFKFDQQGWRKKRKLKEQVQEFWRRRDKAEAEVGDIPPEHPAKKGLEDAIKAATDKAKNGDIKGAYKDLEGTKTQARQIATTIRGGISLATVQGDVAVLKSTTRRLADFSSDAKDFADSKTQPLLTRASQLPDVTGATREEVMDKAMQNFREKQEILKQWDGVATEVDTKVKNFVSAISVKPTVDSLIKLAGHNIALLNKQDSQHSKRPHNSDFLYASSLADTHNLKGSGGELKSEIKTLVDTRREALLQALKAKTAVPKTETSTHTDKQGKALTGEDAKKAEEELSARFKSLEEAEKKRLEAAKQAYRDAIYTDIAFLSSTVDTSPMVNRELRKFDTAEEMEEAGIDLTDTAKTPQTLADASGTLIGQKFDALMQNAGPKVPDEVFEMCSRSNRDWYIEAAKSAGISFDPDKPETIDPTVWAKIKAAGDKMAEVVRDKYPNKSTFKDGKPDVVTIGGKIYSGFERLGSGGGGEVWRGKDASGKSVVLKTPKGFKGNEVSSEKEFQDFSGEAANHRAASGGEFDPCPENILDMQGMVLAPNGLPLIVMDLAESGDADGFSTASKGAEAAGLMSPQAVKAMNAAAMQDMLKGLKAMQASGMTHHDLKSLNVFVDKNGTFKVADFGLAQHAESHSAAVGDLSEFTPGYEAPELEGEGNLTQKSDNFAMGAILQKMVDPYSLFGSVSDRFSYMNPTKEQNVDTAGKATTASAADRLINGLLEPDPDKRPTIDAALMSSFFSDIESTYTKEDVERLKKATAAYSATVGRALGTLPKDIEYTEGEIVKLEMSKTDALLQAEIHHYSRSVERYMSQARDLQKKADRAWISKEKDKLLEGVKKATNQADGIQKKVDQLQAKLGTAKSALDVEAIDKKIEAKRQEVIGYRKKIEEINKKAEFKDIVEELEAANKAFA